MPSGATSQSIPISSRLVLLELAKTVALSGPTRDAPFGNGAVVKAGANTETEMKERKDLIDDALHATKAAAEEGIVPGGGVDAGAKQLE